MKMYFVCSGRDDWWTCFGVLNNGFVFGSHVCSHPGFAKGDLYFTRSERIAALKEIFGIDETTIDHETLVVNRKSEEPSWWEGTVNNKELQESFKPQYDRYRELLKKDD